MIVFSLNGECGISGIWSVMTAARSFGKSLLNIPIDATHYVRYTTGAVAGLQVGETLTGGTSAATAVIVAQVIENGVAGGSSDAGVLFLKRISGTPTATGETWTGGTSTGTVVTAQAPLTLKVGGCPKSALITIETATLTMTMDGVTPTASAGTNYGHQIAAGQSYVNTGLDNLTNFQAINTVNANGAIMKYSLFY